MRAKLARVDAEIAAGTTTPPSWGVEDYQAALQNGLSDISGLLELATSDEKNALYQLVASGSPTPAPAQAKDTSPPSSALDSNSGKECYVSEGELVQSPPLVTSP